MDGAGPRGPFDDWLYVLVVGSLALYLIIGVVAWSWMILAGVAAPEAFTTVLSTVVGGLIGIVAPQGSRRARRDERDERDDGHVT